MTTKRPLWVWVTSIIAVAFGVMTIKSGGSVLFIDGEARRAAGNVVDFVLWFNFTAGFFYITAGIGIWLEKSWTPILAIAISVLTLVVFGLLGLHILNAGEYEQRTVMAMTLRSTIWAVISILCYRKMLLTSRTAD